MTGVQTCALPISVESLAHRMAGVDHPVERFRVLNGLDGRAQVKVRDKVKIVVD